MNASTVESTSMDMLMPMDNDTVAIAITFLVATLLAIHVAYSHASDKKLYPPYAPGSMWQHIQIITSPQYLWWILDVASQLNSRVFRINIPIQPLSHKVMVGEVQTCRQILQDPLTEKPMEVYSPFRKAIGGCPTTFTTGGKEWRAKRKSVAPSFSSNHVKRMTRVALEMTEKWMKDMTSGDDYKASFDVGKEMVGITLSAISETAFEYSMSPQEKEQYGHDVELSLIEFALKAPLNPARTLFGLFLPQRRRAFAAVENLKTFMFKVMNSYRQLQNPTNGTIIQRVLQSNAFPTETERAAQLLEFMLAGHETTAYSISWILFELARNSEEQRKLRDSLSKLSPDQWSQSHYLKMAIREGMRLHPVAAGGAVRTPGRDIVTSRGELIPKGSICFLPHILLFRNPDIFSEPDSFQPSRWEEPSQDMLDAFNPFSLGKQNCVGQSLANAETYAIVAKICSEYELSVVDEGTRDFFLTLKPVGVILKARRV